MKGNGKKILLIILLVVIVAGGGFVYNYYSMYKEYKEIVIDKDSDGNITIDEDKLSNPFDAVIETDDENAEQGELDDNEKTEELDKTKEEDGTQVDSAVNTVTDKPTNNKDNPKKPQNLTNTQKPQKKSYSQIVNSYRVKFESLQSKQEGNLNGLIDQAKVEYIDAKKNGKSLLKLATKYIKSGGSMEKQSDRDFNKLKKQMQSELKSNSYDTSIVKDIEAYYNQRKKILKGSIMNQVKDL